MTWRRCTRQRGRFPRGWSSPWLLTGAPSSTRASRSTSTSLSPATASCPACTSMHGKRYAGSLSLLLDQAYIGLNSARNVPVFSLKLSLQNIPAKTNETPACHPTPHPPSFPQIKCICNYTTDISVEFWLLMPWYPMPAVWQRICCPQLSVSGCFCYSFLETVPPVFQQKICFCH